MNINRKMYYGAIFKVDHRVVSEGFSMEDENCDFSVRVYNGDKEKVYTKDDGLLVIDDTQCAFLVDTRELGVGTYYIETTINIPDRDFSTNRIAIDRKELCPVVP